MQRPFMLQWFLQPWIISLQSTPVQPALQTHLFVAGLQRPLTLQPGLQEPMLVAHAEPAKPVLHMHRPCVQVPWPEQSGFGQTSRIAQSLPPQPALQMHFPGSSQLPWPLQQLGTEQSTPRKPA